MHLNPSSNNHDWGGALVALLVATALHAAIIFGVDWPTSARSTQSPALSIVLTEKSGPTIKTDVGIDVASDPAAQRSTISGSDPPSPREGERDPGRPAPALSDSTAKTAATEDAPIAHQARATDSPAQKAGGRESPNYVELAKAIASSHARSELDQASGPVRTRSKRLTRASAGSAVEAAYLAMWQQKVERIGRANYPPGRIEGELSVLATIRHDGALQEARILESSGHPALDAAALRIVRLAAPFSHFPTDLRKDYDRLEIVRQWRFERRGR